MTSFISFSEDQQQAYDACIEKKNVFITGPGGCGKTFLIKHIVQKLKEQNRHVQVCAMTGCAAILLECNATTLHSWSGIGLAKGDPNMIVTRIMCNTFKRKNWKKTDVLILDEVSMLSKGIFELLDTIGKRVHSNPNKPFGGMQVIFSGDFYQLSPVPTKGDDDSRLFCFQSPLWKQTFDLQILLDEPFRQKDPIFLDLLYQVREGSISKRNVALLQEKIKVPEKHAKMVRLVSTRRQAEEINTRNMNELKNPIRTYKYEHEYEPPKSQTHTQTNIQANAHPLMIAQAQAQMQTQTKSKTDIKNEVQYMTQHSLFENELQLQVGCRVMCIANIDMDNGIVNGSTGEVIDFNPLYPIVQFDNGVKMTINRHHWNSENIDGLRVSQLPLILAWAVTIHKSQGATLDSACIDLGNNVFASGQTYVALSRVRTLHGLYLTSFNPHKIRANKDVSEFYEQFYA